MVEWLAFEMAVELACVKVAEKVEWMADVLVYAKAAWTGAMSAAC